jgi:Rieske Fe-S protein
MVDLNLSRRQVLVGSAGVLALASCADPATSESTSTTTSGSTPASAAGEVVAQTGDFPTGGGVIVSTSVGPLVVTQPADGEFAAFSAKCPHQGCPVAEVTENTIVCNCHGSTFDAASGARLDGPAPRGLAPVAVTVSGTDVVLA